MRVTYKLRGKSCAGRYDVTAIKCIQINPSVFIPHVFTHNSVYYVYKISMALISMVFNIQYNILSDRFSDVYQMNRYNNR